MGKTLDYRILIIDKDAKHRDDLAAHLRTHGVPSVSAATGGEGLQLVREGSPDLILLASQLPDQKGTELCHAIRTETSTPIILLSRHDNDEECIEGLQAGADDYLGKPYSERVLMARIEAALRRSNGVAPNASSSDAHAHSESHGVLTVGNVRLELTTCRVYFNNTVKTLTPNEFRLMAVFMRAPGEVFTREDLRRRVWPDDQHSLHLVEVHIANLRAKIEPDAHHPQYIVTVRSRGYKFSTPSSEEAKAG